MALTQVIRPSRIFYGWYIVALAFIALFTATGLQGFSAGIFMKPMTEDLGWTRGGMSGAQSAGTVVSGIIGLFIGGLIDRRGARMLVIFGAIISGIGFASLSLVQEIWQFYLVRALLITVGTTCTGQMVVITAVSNWFVRKRGIAVACAAMGTPFAGVLLNPFSQLLIDSYGWRNAWIVLGAMVWTVVIIPTALFMRRRPEDLGLWPDGEAFTEEKERQLNAVQKAAIKADVRWTRREAMRTSTLWMIIVSTGFASMTLTTTMVHVVPYISDLGFAPVVAASAAAVQSVLSITSKVVWGFLIDRVQVRYMAVFTYGFAALGFGLLLGARSIEAIIIALVVLGIGVGGCVPVSEVVWASYFGRISLGTVRSIGMPFAIISSAGGPLMAGVVYDMSKSYEWAFIFLMSTLILGALTMLFLRPARHPRDLATASAA